MLLSLFMIALKLPKVNREITIYSIYNQNIIYIYCVSVEMEPPSTDFDTEFGTTGTRVLLRSCTRISRKMLFVI